MNAESVRSAYDAWHERYEVDRDVDTPWHQLLFAHMDPDRDLAGRRVLEIACGRGGLASRLASQPHAPAALVAADISLTAVKKGLGCAASARARNLKWSVSDLHSVAFRDAAFDTVISCESIEHLAHPRGACDEFARVLKPGGRLYLTTPNYLGPLGAYRGYLRLIGRRYSEEGQPVNRFMLLPVTCGWLRRSGFRILSVKATGHYLPWPGRPPIRFRGVDQVASLRWFALHSLVVAEKL